MSKAISPIVQTAIDWCRAADAMGGLDIQVDSAGVITRGLVTEASDDDYRRTMAINVEVPFHLGLSAIPIMAKAGGGATRQHPSRALACSRARTTSFK